MPLTSQGKFQTYYNEKNRIVVDYNKMRQQYFPNGFYNAAFDVFSDFFYDVDSIFREALNCRNNIQGLINVAEIKTKESAEKLQNACAELDVILKNCVSDFQSLYDIRKKDGFTPIENATFGNYRIMAWIQR